MDGGNIQRQQHPRIIIGITGASGALYGVRLLESLKLADVETHLIISDAAALTVQQETGLEPETVADLASHTYPPQDIGATIASGSFVTAGMVVAPCSIKTLSAIAYSYTDNLLTRAADVTLKEGRPLILMVRETPLHLGHLRLMTQAAEIGAVIFPPVPALYSHPQTIDEMVQHTVGRILARLGFTNQLYKPWQGLP